MALIPAAKVAVHGAVGGATGAISGLTSTLISNLIKFGEVHKKDLKLLLQEFRCDTSRFEDLWQFFKRRGFVTLCDSDVVDFGNYKKKILQGVKEDIYLAHFTDTLE